MPSISNTETTKIAYETNGAGPPLLLIAGLGCDRNIWKPFQVAELSKHFQVIIFDNRGIGESDKPQGPYSTAQMADDAADLLTQLDIVSAHILGHSMGGMISLEFAIRHPDKTKTLIVASGIDRADEWMKTKQIANQGLSKLEVDEPALRESIAWMNIMWMFDQTYFGKTGAVNRVLEVMKASTQPFEAYRSQSQALANHDATHGLGNIECPTLVILGKEDILTPLRYTEGIVDAIPDARLELIDDCGHMIIFEKPNEFNSLVIDFLKGGVS